MQINLTYQATAYYDKTIEVTDEQYQKLTEILNNDGFSCYKRDSAIEELLNDHISDSEPVEIVDYERFELIED